jgi:AraC-like DNA-binding protein
LTITPPSSAVRTFTDPDEYAASIRRASVQLTVIERGQFNATLTRVDLHDLRMQRTLNDLSGVTYVVSEPGRVYVTFSAHDSPRPLWRGLEMTPTSVVRHGRVSDFYQRSFGSTCIGAMSLPVEKMALLGVAVAGSDLTPPRDGLIVTPKPSAIARLQRLHGVAGRLAATAPEIIAHPEAARGLEQSLIAAMIDCLATEGRDADRAACGRHDAIMRRFQAMLTANPDRSLHVPELCTAIGVTERTLRRCCQEQLGMGPNRFLVWRRLSLARRALRTADPAATTIAAVAARFGFWDFGRFSGAYRSLYGE